jgi:hypothetical protein
MRETEILADAELFQKHRLEIARLTLALKLEDKN